MPYYTGAVVVNGGHVESVKFKAASYDTYGNKSGVLAITADVNIVSGKSELKIPSEIIKEFEAQDVDVEVNITTLTQD